MAPSAGALTTAGYTQSPTGVWTQTFGSIVVVFNLVDEPDSGYLTVTPTGDDLASDVTNASNSLSALGYPALAANVPVAGDDQEDLGSVEGLTAFSMSL